MAAAIAITPWRESNSQTKPMRRIFWSRSSLPKPRPFERWVRTTSPSSSSTLAFNWRSRCSSSAEIVLLPAPDSPVNQSVNPLCIARYGPVRRKMDAALFPGVFFPPPAPRPFAFFRANGACARLTSDTGIPARVERMHRHIVFADVFLHLLRTPIGQWVDLDSAVRLLYFGNAGARSRLCAPQPRCPCPQRAQFARQGANLAHIAAQLPGLRAVVKEIGAVPGDHPLHFLARRKDHFEVDPVALTHGLDHPIGFVRQAARVQREHAHPPWGDLRTDPRRHIQDRHPLFLQAGSNGERVAISFESPRENFGSRSGFELRQISQSLSRLRSMAVRCQTHRSLRRHFRRHFR